MAATFDGSITPPPPVGIRTPPTPRLGYHDNWEPFTPRKSARISSQRTRTPSPNSSHRQPPRSPRTVKKSTKHNNPSTVSPMHSPQKKRQPALDSVRRASSRMSAEGTQAAAALGLEQAPIQRPANLNVARASGMLPTPSKTPQKPPNEKTAANIKSFARNLFPSDAEAMPSPKKRRAKKYTGISMDSFTAEEIEEPIEIFTDSQDRVPTKDESEANPFYGDDAAPVETTKRRSKRKQVNIPGEGAYSIDEASRREDGMVYVFRGKKFFRKFSDNDNEDVDELLDEEVDDDARLARPLTRSSIKPRLLFQTVKTAAMIEEEEAATDVEENEDAATDIEDEQIDKPAVVPQTPVKPHQKRASTPEAPKFAPVSPPDTRRTTRSANKLAEESKPIKPTSRKSPFDSWRRTKEHKGASTSKRPAEALTPSHATKRARI
ncbi:hypothetical protein EDB81DRAFT_853799 [Dactylonectria macrodidyma]|uniref:Uncharacterized protein n=1 Tax=Dactylonectria macrodidyma TaxID=307937 RepID=A0A9P9JDG1_9HYPO|nr:hypothetical protein EDB81DRAFT_853799 [Dactylonectria macrodidyma]